MAQVQSALPNRPAGPGRRRLLFRALGLGLVALLGLVPGRATFGQAGPAARPIDLVLLIDSSGSTASTDPSNLRVSTAAFLLDYVRAIGQTQGVTYRAAAANFNSQVSDAIPLQPIQGDVTRLAPSARSAGGTDFAPALAFANSVRTTAGTANPMAVVLFTDGRPDPAPDLNAYFQTLKPVVDSLQQSGAQLFVVAVGDTPEDARQWTDLISTAHYRSVSSTTDLAGVYHDFLADLLGLRADQERALNTGTEQTVTIEPYLEQAIFSVFKDQAGAQTTLLNPANTVIPASAGNGPADLYSVYVVTTPPAGDWRIRISAGGARLAVDRRLATLQIDPLDPIQAMNRPLDVTGRLVVQQAPVIDADLSLQLVAQRPNGQTGRSPLARQSDGRYTATLTNLDASGTYTLSLAAQRLSQPILAQTRPVTVSVFPAPAILRLDPQGSPLILQPLTLTVSLSNADQAGPNMRVLVRVRDAGNQLLGATDLHNDGQPPDAQANDDLYTGLTTLPAIAGRYTFEAVLQGRTVHGVPLDSAAVLQVPVDVLAAPPPPTPTAAPTTSPTPAPAGGFDFPDALPRRYQWWGIGLLVGFVVGGGLAWQYRGQLREAVSEIRVAVAKLDTERRAREEAEKEAERERQRAERAEEEARQGAAEARRNEEEARRAAAEARRVAEEARQERQRAQETEEEARQQRERAEKAEREANEQKAMVEAFEATNEYLTKARSLHNEAKRLRLDGQKKEANERFQEAIYYYKQYKDSTRRIGKNELKSLYAEWLTPDNKPLPQAEALPIIRVQARSDDLEELLGLAEVLPSLWQDRQTEALRLVYDECLAEGASRTFLQAISETESNVLSRLFKASLDAVRQQEIRILTTESIGALIIEAQILGDSGVGLERTYQALMVVMEHQDPLAPSDRIRTAFDRAEQALQTRGPDIIHELVTTAEKVFDLPRASEQLSTIAYLHTVLAHLENGLVQMRVISWTPERTLFNRVIEWWIRHVKTLIVSFSSPGQLAIEIKPSLDLDLEEETLDNDLWRYRLPVRVKNTGDTALSKFVTALSISGVTTPVNARQIGDIADTGDTDTPDTGDKLGAELPAGSTTCWHLAIDAPPAESLVVVTSRYRRKVYNRETLKVDEEDDTQKSNTVQLAPSLAESERVYQLSNPYVYDRALVAETQWRDLVRGEAPAIAERILLELQAASEENEGRMLALRGLRRIGKTTILARVVRQAELAQAADGQTPRFLAAYLDLKNWLRGAIHSPDTLHMPLEILFWRKCIELFQDALEKYTTIPGIDTQVRSILRATNRVLDTDENRSLEALQRMLQSAGRKIGITPVLIIDEADSFANRAWDTRRAPSADLDRPILYRLAPVFRTLMQEFHLVLIVAHDHAEAEWPTGDLHPQFIRIPFLDETQTQALAQVTHPKVKWTELALKTFWLFTGGYPGLVQLLAYYLIDKIKAQQSARSVGPANKPRPRFLITGADVKQAIRAMNQSADWAQYLDYLSYGFHPAELRLLLTLAAKDHTDMYTGEIRGVEVRNGQFVASEGIRQRYLDNSLDLPAEAPVLEVEDLLRRLTDKQILRGDETGHALLWQVGWLYVIMGQIAPGIRKKIDQVQAQVVGATLSPEENKL